MNTTMTRKGLEEVFDQITREVTEQAAGICLYEGEALPDGELCTVYTNFECGFCTGLSMCAEESLFTRLTQNMMQCDEVTPVDVEDFTKEFFNVLCGCIARRMFYVTRLPSRFGIPDFRRGRYVPDGWETHFVLRYISDGEEYVQLTHYR